MSSVADTLFNHFDINNDNEIDVSELHAALCVDTDNDGIISDTVQSRTITNSAGETTSTSWTEAEVVAKAIGAYMLNEAKFGDGDGIITRSEFNAIFNSPFE